MAKSRKPSEPSELTDAEKELELFEKHLENMGSPEEPHIYSEQLAILRKLAEESKGNGEQAPGL